MVTPILGCSSPVSLRDHSARVDPVQKISQLAYLIHVSRVWGTTPPMRRVMRRLTLDIILGR
jgi:hypothetical protein